MKFAVLIITLATFPLLGQDLPPPPQTPQMGELQQIDTLIEVTEQNLQREKHIRDLATQYLILQKSYQSDLDNREKLIELVKAAHTLLEEIKANHLTHVFSTDFISELSLFSQVAVKRGIPRPS